MGSKTTLVLQMPATLLFSHFSPCKSHHFFFFSFSPSSCSLQVSILCHSNGSRTRTFWASKHYAVGHYAPNIGHFAHLPHTSESKFRPEHEPAHGPDAQHTHNTRFNSFESDRKCNDSCMHVNILFLLPEHVVFTSGPPT